MSKSLGLLAQPPMVNYGLICIERERERDREAEAEAEAEASKEEEEEDRIQGSALLLTNLFIYYSLLAFLLL